MKKQRNGLTDWLPMGVLPMSFQGHTRRAAAGHPRSKTVKSHILARWPRGSSFVPKLFPSQSDHLNMICWLRHCSQTAVLFPLIIFKIAAALSPGFYVISSCPPKWCKRQRLCSQNIISCQIMVKCNVFYIITQELYLQLWFIQCIHYIYIHVKLCRKPD